jgi:hypothetical protein
MGHEIMAGGPVGTALSNNKWTNGEHRDELATFTRLRFYALRILSSKTLYSMSYVVLV